MTTETTRHTAERWEVEDGNVYDRAITTRYTVEVNGEMRTGRDGLVAIVYDAMKTGRAPVIAAAPEMALALDATARLWHYDHAGIPGSPCYNVAFSHCDGLQCATNRALLRRIDGG